MSESIRGLTLGPYVLERDDFLVGDERTRHDAGRVLEHRGQWQFLAGENEDDDGAFLGRLSDPMPVRLEGGMMHVDASAARV